MPIGTASRFFRGGATRFARYVGHVWNTRRANSVDVGSGYGISVDDNDSITNIRNFGTAGTVMTQGAAGDRPTVDKATIAGATLVETINDDHMTAAVSGQLLTIAVAFRDDGSSSERALLARDTSAVTDKPAFDLSIIVE